MSDDIIKDIFEIRQENQYEFKKVFGFTFVFKTTMTMLRKKISSVEIKPIGIIYEENDEYYFAPIIDEVDNIREIIEKYVENV